MEMCRWLFQGFTDIQNGRHISTLIFGGAQFFFRNFNITFLATWGCASDFLKMLPKLKMAARGELQSFLWAQKLQNLKSEIIQILLSHPPRRGDVQVFFKVLLIFKMAAMDKLYFFCGRKSWKIEVSNNSHCTITLPTIWKCACDFTEI